MRRRTFLAAIPALALSPAVGAPAAEEPVSLPFDFAEEKRILIPVTVNGRPARALVDSGASATVLDLAFANRIGISLGRSGRATGIAEKVAVRLARAELEVAGRALRTRFVAAIDLAAVSQYLPEPVQVILGRELFDGHVVDLDFAARILKLAPRVAFVAPAEAPLPLRATGGLRTVPIDLGGGAPTAAIFDLGNDGSLMVERAFADRSRLLAGRRLSTRLVVGADGPRDTIVATLAEIRLGGTAFHDVPVIAAAKLDGKVPANVGIDLLSRFRLAIDFDGSRIWMRPYPDAADKPFPKDRSGLAFRPEGDRLIVAHVAQSSPAEADGWRIGEAVVAIDGRMVGPDFKSTALAHWGYGPAGRTYVFTMADGSKRRIILADYF